MPKNCRTGGGLLFGLKGNQGTLHDDVALFFENTPPDFEIETFATPEKNGGRLEYRKRRKLTQLDWLEQKDRWPGLQTVLAIDRRVTTKKGTGGDFQFRLFRSKTA